MVNRDAQPTDAEALSSILSFAPPVARPPRRAASARACLIGIAASAIVAGCAGADLGEGEASPVLGTDPAGVELEDYGLSEAPCGQDTHLATVVTADRAYHAFCADEQGRASVFVLSRLEAEVEVNQKSALEHFLAITPPDVTVPDLLEGAAQRRSGRELTAEVVAYVHPDARGPLQRDLDSKVAPASSCSSASDFEEAHCSVIDEWIASDDEFNQTHSWCSSGLLAGDAQRTGSQQGVSFPFEGRIRVAGCTDDVVVRRYYKNPFNGSWWNAGNLTLQPGHVMSWTIFADNAIWCPGGLEICQFASDLRFRVEPTPGGTYRYTGGFINYEPVP